MPLWTEDDIDALINDDDLAETVYYFPSYGNADVVSVWGEGIAIVAGFSDSFKMVDLVSGSIVSTEPALQFKTDSILTLMESDRFVVRGTKYDIIDIEPDGTGLTTVRLKKV